MIKNKSLIIITYCFGCLSLQANNIEIQIAQKNEDAEEFIKSQKVYINSSDLELGEDKEREQITGLRFNKISIPKGSTITNAYIQFTVDELSSKETHLKIYGEKSLQSNAFTSKKGDISSRQKTDTFAEWSPEAWMSIKLHGNNERTPDLSSIVQEIIEQENWQDSLAFFISGQGKRTAESFDGSKSKAPILYIEYENSQYNAPTGSNSVGDFIWEDSNRNGIQDPEEAGIDNISVQLLRHSDKKVLATTVTKNGGSYLFENIQNGTYIIQVDKKEYSVTQKNISDEFHDSSAYHNGRSSRFVLNGEQLNKSIDIGLYKKELQRVEAEALPLASPQPSIPNVQVTQVQTYEPTTEVQCSLPQYICINNSQELISKVESLKGGETIILKEGIYNLHNLRITQPNITIASEYFIDHDINHISNTILNENDLKDTEENPRNEYLIKGLNQNLHIVGLTFTNVKKGVGFFQEGGLVDHCDISTNFPSGSDAISFESIEKGGGEVKYTSTYSRDEGVDIDLKLDSQGSGTYWIHHNSFRGNPEKGDDLIEMRIYAKGGNYQVLIEENEFNNAHGNAIQFIDYRSDDNSYKNSTHIEIRHNIIKNSRYSGIDTTMNTRSKRNHRPSVMQEKIDISNNYFFANGHHIDGGYNMHIRDNIFYGDNFTKNALAWVKKSSTVQGNIFFKNLNNYLDTNKGANNREANSIEELNDFATNNNIKLSQ